MATLELRGLKKYYGNTHAVDGIDAIIAEGEFLAILGPSGCGKSTTMRMIAGLEAPTAGEVLIGGKSVTHLPPRARNVSMVFQSYALYPHLSVRENIAFPLKARGVPRTERDAKIQWASAMAESSHRAAPAEPPTPGPPAPAPQPLQPPSRIADRKQRRLLDAEPGTTAARDTAFERQLDIELCAAQ